MVKKTVLSLVCTGALLAGNTTEVEQLKQQMAQLQQQLEQMQQHIATLEAQAPKETTASEESLESMEKSPTSSVTTLLPDIALILNGGYTSRNISNYKYSNASIPGFVDAGNMEIPFNKKDGFNLNYAEVAMSSTVDPYLDASAIFHIHGDGQVEVEEAYFTTRALDYGLRVKAGKFKSAFGRVNEKHHHAWNFEDQELINNALFGPDGLGGEGVQVQWVAPTPLYLMAGFELFNGNPEQGFSAKESASTAVGYLKTSTDVGAATLLAGLSYAQGKSEVQNLDGLGDPIPDSFSNYGRTRIYGADLTLEYPLENYGQLIWQNEWMQRNKDVDTLTQKQSGYYSELLYKINENWATGVRYDEIYQNRTGDPLTSIDHLNRTSVKLDYKPFEFSRFRLQYNQDHSKYIDDQAKTIHEIMLNYTLELGAHGAHAF